MREKKMNILELIDFFMEQGYDEETANVLADDWYQNAWNVRFMHKINTKKEKLNDKS